MRFNATYWLNETPGHRFWRYEEGDELTPVPGLFSAEGATVEEALAELWDVGNKMAVDADGRSYPRDHRSVSAGDVIAIEGGDRWACEMIGWRKLEPSAVA